MATSRTRPFIGINADLTTPAKCGPVARLPIGYVDAVIPSGGTPVTPPPLTKDLDFGDLLERLDGVVLSGGLDIDPKRAGLPSHAAVVPMAERREASDRRL